MNVSRMADKASKGGYSLRDVEDGVTDGIAKSFFVDVFAREEVVAKRVEERVGGTSAARAGKGIGEKG